MTLPTPPELRGIELALGRPLTPFEQEQAGMFAETVRMLIERAVTATSSADPRPAVVVMVVREAVAARLRNASNLGQVSTSVQIEGSSLTKHWSKASNGVEILPEWWEWLGIAIPTGEAFSIELARARGPLRTEPTGWWTTILARIP